MYSMTTSSPLFGGRVGQRLVAVAALAAATGVGSTAAAGTIALDNTAGGTASLRGDMGSLTSTNWNLKVFTVGSSDATISSMAMGFYASSVANYDITWELYAVDGSNDPTGAVLASDTQSQSFTRSAAYYTFATGGDLASYSMQAGQTYGLLFKSNASGPVLSWTQTNAASIYSPGSSGFSFVANRRSTNSGTSFNSNSYYNAWQMETSASSAVVPGPGVAGLAFIGLAGVAGRRRR